jgi:hypothetical protein
MESTEVAVANHDRFIARYSRQFAGYGAPDFGQICIESSDVVTAGRGTQDGERSEGDAALPFLDTVGNQKGQVVTERRFARKGDFEVLTHSRSVSRSQMEIVA